MAPNTALIREIARRHGASTIQMFGSYLHGTQKDDSDLDPLVNLEPGRGLFNLVALKRDLERESFPVATHAKQILPVTPPDIDRHS